MLLLQAITITVCFIQIATSRQVLRFGLLAKDIDRPIIRMIDDANSIDSDSARLDDQSKSNQVKTVDLVNHNFNDNETTITWNNVNSPTVSAQTMENSAQIGTKNMEKTVITSSLQQMNENRPENSARTVSSGAILVTEANRSSEKPLSRPDWLAKEYFSYVCAPETCIHQKLREQVRDECFGKHDKLRQVMDRCMPEKQCNSSTISCVMDINRRDPFLISLGLHDCVDGLVTMRMWKCIQREQLINPISFPTNHN